MTKLCKDCKFFSSPNWALKECLHPNNGISPVDGKVIRNLAYGNRFNPERCGEEGKWWEEVYHKVVVHEFVWTTITGIQTYETSEEDFEKALKKAKAIGYKPRKWYNPLTWQNYHIFHQH
jgi:hypothetical protein